MGNALADTDLTFAYAVKEVRVCRVRVSCVSCVCRVCRVLIPTLPASQEKATELKAAPFQVQIHYTRKDGMQVIYAPVARSAAASF